MADGISDAIGAGAIWRQDLDCQPRAPIAAAPLTPVAAVTVSGESGSAATAKEAPPTMPATVVLSHLPVFLIFESKDVPPHRYRIA